MNQPQTFAKQLIFVDEGDLVLERAIMEKLATSKAKNVILLSALPQTQWTLLQLLSFNSMKNKISKYADVSGVFPEDKFARIMDHTDVLPPKPQDILKLAVEKAK